MKALLGFYILLSTSLPLSATEILTKPSKPQPLPQIESIEFKIFDRQKNTFVENTKQSDPYGMHSDVFVTVKLSNVGDNEVTLKVTASTPKTDDEARGTVTATSQSNTLTVNGPDPMVSKLVTAPFLFRYECNPMTIVAEIVGQKVRKEIKASLGCAE